MKKMKLTSQKSTKNQKPPAEKKSKPAKKVKKAKEPSGAGKKIAVAAIVIFVVVIGGFFAIGAYAGSVKTIYPNVSLEGVELSGMTLAEAADTLSEVDFSKGRSQELRVSLPAGIEMTVDTKEAGCYMTAADAAVFAYEYCHGNGFFANTITYLKCVANGIELTVGDGAILNEEYLQKAVSDAAKEIRLALLDGNLEIGDESITVIKGVSLVQINETQLLETIKAALESGNFSPIEYDAEVAASGNDEEIDLERLYETVFVEPQNAEYNADTKTASDSVEGRSFDIDVARALWDTAIVGDVVVIPLIFTQPEITTEILNSMLFSDLLSQKSTTLSGSSAARINNIKKASESINGLIMNPGEEFSFNGTVGQRTAAAGYMGAGAYNNGKVVTEIGGGICQVSSTLYYCTLIANLQITNRLCHYFGVDYLPAGLDATVSWPEPDFKFKNNGDYPIKIEAYVDSAANTVVVKIYGSNPDGIRVEMTTETWSYSDGYGAASYRWVYDKNGNLISKTEEASSRYYYKTAASEENETPSPSPSGEVPSPEPSDPVVSPDPSTPVDPPPVSPDPTVPVDPPAPESTGE